MKRQVGVFTANILNCIPSMSIDEGTPIYLGDSNIEHMKSSHPDDYSKYGTDIELILSNPDYIGINKNDSSIEFVKEYIMNDEYVKVAVRISMNNNYYARSIYTLNNSRVRNFIEKGTLIKLTNKKNEV